MRRASRRILKKQITYTLMALAYRACDHLVEEFRAGNI
jgi:hypothetical protein